MASCGKDPAILIFQIGKSKSIEEKSFQYFACWHLVAKIWVVKTSRTLLLPVVIQQRLKNGAIHPERVEPLLPCSTELFPGMALCPRQRFVPAAGMNPPSVPHSPRSLRQDLVLVYHLPSRSPQPCKPSVSSFPPEEQTVTLLKGACILGGCQQLHCYGRQPVSMPVGCPWKLSANTVSL